MSTTIGTSNNSATYKPQVSSAGNSTVSPQQRLGNLFQQIDTAGTGHITKAQFDQAFNSLSLPVSIKEMGKEAAYKKIDSNETGTVTKQEFIRGLEPYMNQKASAPNKSATTEAKPAANTKEPEKTITSQSQPDDKSPTADGRAVGNIINTTA